LRALAALAVFAYHSSGITYTRADLPISASVVGWLRHLGFFGVSVFFVISGFLLYRPFAAATLRGTAMPRRLPFWKRRLFRIFPAYWVALAVAVFALHQGKFSSFEETVTHFLLAQNYRGQYTGLGLGVAWTLVIEVSFYLVLPFLAVALDRSTRRFGGARNKARALVIALAGMALLAVLLRAWWLTGSPRPGASFGAWLPLSAFGVWLPAFLDWFALGMVMAVGVEWLRAGGRVPRAVELIGRHPWIAWLLAIECYWVLTEMGLGGFIDASRFSATQSNLRWIFTGLAAAFFVFPAVFGPQDRGAVRALLRNPIAVALGVISYGIYLWHFPMWLVLLSWPETAWLSTRGWLQIAIVLGMTLVAAAASYTLVERPLISWSAGRSAPGLFAWRRESTTTKVSPALAASDRGNGTMLIAAAVVSVAVAGLIVSSAGLRLLPRVDPFTWEPENAIVADAFDRPDQRGLGDAATGQPWQALSGDWAVDNGRATVAAGTTPSFAIIQERGDAPMMVRATLAGDVDYAGLAFRCHDEENCWWLEAQPRYATWNLNKIVDGETTYVGNIGVATSAPGKLVVVVLDGDDIAIVVDGRIRFTLTDADLAGERGAGLARGAGGTTSATWTRFEVS
jgi:peptidoglycan/LPS O-acetylase OafA/YrhL